MANAPAPHITVLPLDGLGAGDEQPPTQPSARPNTGPAAPRRSGGHAHPAARSFRAPPANAAATAGTIILPGKPPAAPWAKPTSYPPAAYATSLERRIAPHPIAPPDLALIAALKGWQGAVAAGLLLAVASVAWRRSRKPPPPQEERKPAAATPARPLSRIPASVPPAEPRPPRRVDCLDTGAEAPSEPRLGRHQRTDAPALSAPADSAPQAPDVPPDAGQRGSGRNRAAARRAEKAGQDAGATATRARSHAPGPADEALSLAFEPLRFSATLAHVVLPYRLSVTNRTEAPLGPITIAGDMIAADAAAPLAPLAPEDASPIPTLHEMPLLAPGETAHVRGEFRLPLGAITPLRVGAAALLVPLVRLKVVAERTPPGKASGRRKRAPAPSAEPLCRHAQFILGEPDDGEADRLHPFRLDLGPRSWTVAALGGLELVA